MSAGISSSETLRISYLQDLSTAIQKGTCRARHYLALQKADRIRLLSKLDISAFDWELIKNKMKNPELEERVKAEVSIIVQEIQPSATEQSTQSKIQDCWQKEMVAASPSVITKGASDLTPIEKDLSERDAQKIKDRDLVIFFQNLSCYASATIRHTIFEQGDNDTNKATLIRAWMYDNPNILEGVTQIIAIRSELKTIPPEIALLPNLKTLMLTHGQIESVPDEIGQLSHLEMLSLPHNKIKRISPEIGRLTKLKTLALAHNQLETLPKELVRLSALQRIGLKGNPLKFLPLEIRQLKKFPKISI